MKKTIAILLIFVTLVSAKCHEPGIQADPTTGGTIQK